MASCIHVWTRGRASTKPTTSVTALPAVCGLVLLLPMSCFSFSMDYRETRTVHAHARDVYVGNFNGDRYSDLLVTNSANRDLQVLYGNASGSYPGPVAHPGGEINVLNAAVGDFNKDSRDDLAVLGGQGAQLGIYLGQVESGFSAPIIYSGFAEAMLTEDFDKDGDLDLALATPSGADIRLGNGDGTFQETLLTRLPTTARFGIAAGDVDRDGIVDLVLPDSASMGVHLLRGLGNGEFQHMAELAMGEAPYGVLLKDLNLDGELDLVSANYYASNWLALSVRNGLGGGEFAAPVLYGGDVWHFREVHAGDFTADGWPDLALTRAGYIQIYENAGDGTFAKTGFLGNGNAVYGSGTKIVDLNRDALPDLVSVTTVDNPSQLTLYYNTFQIRKSALGTVQKKRIASGGEWFQDVVFNYSTRNVEMGPVSNAPAALEMESPFAQWGGLFHYEFGPGRFTQALYNNRLISYAPGTLQP